MIEVALFGAGRIGKIHAANLARHPNARLRYVVDVHDAAAAELARAHGARVASAEQALADPAVNAVVIGSSTDTHADLIQRSALAGKAIFCEKPVDLDIGRARACADTIARTGVACMIGFQRRFDPTFRALKQRLDAGEIGAPEVLLITSRDPGPPPLDYIARSGGVFKDMLIHDFDIFRWILGAEAVSVYATGAAPEFAEIAAAGDLTTAAVTLRTRDGALCQINTSRRAAYGYDQRFEVLGSRGLLQAGNLRPTEVVAWNAQAISQDTPEAFFLERYRAAYALEIEHFFDGLSQGTPLHPNIDDGIKALELAELATRSWREGRALDCSI
ncbi:inositol 2-dehydrogenase [Lysobacter capsici]|uniref:inositol 2-dehydrogenase n=1 Tax=Lysobacter capsici TaxID=435897 RepID=UPI00287B63A1|nr:inositol 2-dehydrogenase [Lysobacter capsici]WND78298.1 inositol 2-dehydrogenase [Lysobacter capsici]WND83492.1 inositol 2-dehydrogenase [Lysobacter capsici]